MEKHPFPTREFHINIKCKVTVPNIPYVLREGLTMGINVGGNTVGSNSVTAEDIDKFLSEYQAEWWYALSTLSVNGIEVEFEEAK